MTTPPQLPGEPLEWLRLLDRAAARAELNRQDTLAVMDAARQLHDWVAAAVSREKQAPAT